MGFAQSFAPKAPAAEWKFLVLHHSATDKGDVDSIDAVHSQKKDQFGKPWLGIGYHFVIGNGRGMPDGQIEATFRWKEQLHGAHARSRLHNRRGIGICLIGNFENDPPTPRQMGALHELCEWLMADYGIRSDNVLKHLDVAATKCPGRLFPFEELVGSLHPTPLAVGGQSGESEF